MRLRVWKPVDLTGLTFEPFWAARNLLKPVAGWTVPRLTNRPPKLCYHNGTGQAMVYIGGKVRYLGAYDGKHASAEVQEAYKRIVAEWTGRPAPSRSLYRSGRLSG